LRYPDEKETFDLYVQSIQRADLKTLFTTVTTNEAFFFLMSSGALIDTRAGYYRFHEEWFKEKDWESTPLYAPRLTS
jgi:hypothetical protein